MNWAAAAILSWIALGLDVGLASALQLGSGGVRPAFTIMLLAYFACHAPKQDALWIALFLGVVMDLTQETFSPGSMGTVTIVGPIAAGYVVATMLVVMLRGSIMRGSLLAMPFLAGVSVLAVQLVMVTMIEARSWYDVSVEIDATGGLWRGLLIALYTAVVAVPATPLLGALRPVLAFGHQGRSRAWR
jgi:cell shape-determining protein MreD